LGFIEGLHRDWWEADHIVERVRGGGTALSNLQSLCSPCHKAKTRRLHGELAAERRALRSGGSR
jgi:5-methylcytosine-specific restriction endonuclease McrA